MWSQDWSAGLLGEIVKGRMGLRAGPAGVASGNAHPSASAAAECALVSRELGRRGWGRVARACPRLLVMTEVLGAGVGQSPE